MTTITIKNPEKKLSHAVFDTYDDLIDEYYESKGMVLLRPVEDPETIERIEKHQEENKNRPPDFVGLFV